MDLPSRRYKKLVEELGREMKHEYGWKSAVARRLGIHNTNSLSISLANRLNLGQRPLSPAHSPAERWTDGLIGHDGADDADGA